MQINKVFPLCIVKHENLEFSYTEGLKYPKTWELRPLGHHALRLCPGPTCTWGIMGAPDLRPLGTLSTILDSPLLLNSILELWKGLLSPPREYFNRKEKISDNVYYYYRQWRQMLIYMYMFYFVVWGQNWYFFVLIRERSIEIVKLY